MEHQVNRRGFVVRLSAIAVGGLGVRHRVSAPKPAEGLTEASSVRTEAIDVCCPQAYVPTTVTEDAVIRTQAESRVRVGLRLMFSNMIYAPAFFEPDEEETT